MDTSNQLLGRLKRELDGFQGQTKQIAKSGTVQEYFESAGFDWPSPASAKKLELADLFPSFTIEEALLNEALDWGGLKTKINESHSHMYHKASKETYKTLSPASW